MKNKKFVIITMPRSGSNLLVSMLSAHPEIFCDGEVFNRRQLPKKHSSWYIKIVDIFPLWYLKKRIRKMISKGKSIYGFKLLPLQWPKTLEIAVNILHKNDYQLIYLHRKDFIAQIISANVALQKDKWTVNSEKEYTNEKIALDFSLAEYTIDRLQGFDERIKKIKKQYHGLDLYYEDDLLNPEINGPKLAKKIADFLDTETHPLDKYTLKTDIRADRERFSNLDEFLQMCRNIGLNEQVDFYETRQNAS